MSTAATLFFVLVGGLVLMAPPGFLMHRAFLRRLRTDHTGTWERLGRPSPIFYGSIATALSVQRFIRHAEYRSLDDPELSRFCGAYRVFAACYSIVFAAMLIAFSWALLQSRTRTIELPPSDRMMIVSASAHRPHVRT